MYKKPERFVSVLFYFQAYLAEEAVVLFAHRAVESIDSVLIHTPAQAVRRGTVIATLTA